MVVQTEIRGKGTLGKAAISISYMYIYVYVIYVVQCVAMHPVSTNAGSAVLCRPLSVSPVVDMT